MAQQFDSPKTETQLREIQDKLYQHSKEVYDAGGRPAFKGLLEIMTAEPTIVTAIHNIKGNKGSETPGVDFKTMRKDYLEKPYQWVIKDIQNAFKHFQAQKIRRKYIDKPGKTEKRPLGIPTIRDRIVQECMKIVLEPILEAQFFEHSYGFRPMRDTAMALERIKLVSHISGKYWIVEGDISKCFDNIDHSILLKHLYHIGIKDRRVLQIIKAMLKAGIMDECTVNEFGTPQGGIISPLLANAYLDIMDEWIAKQWEHKRTTHHYASSGSRRNALYKTSLTPGWLVRYADDFVIITDTRAHAEQWKARLQTFLQSKLKLTLSTEKTLITDVRKKHIHFLGYEFKMIPGNSRTGYITKTIPDRERLQRKVDSIAESIKKIPQNYSKEQFIGEINRINSQIRGIIQYYQCCTWVNVAVQSHSHRLQLVAKRRLKQYEGKWIPANQTQNLPHVHQKRQQKIPSIKYRDIYIGFTALAFCKWEKTLAKTQEETPYSEEGRQLYFKRSKKKRMNARLDEMYSERTTEAVCYSKWGKLNNFEFIMNRAYALNRDRLKCRICGGWLISVTPCTHRVNPYLPLSQVNRVNNLVSMHKKCLDAVNNPNQNISDFDAEAQKKIKGFRDKLVTSHTRNN
jgi:group II intron reverse transcriptase/maturase